GFEPRFSSSAAKGLPPCRRSSSTANGLVGIQLIPTLTCSLEHFRSHRRRVERGELIDRHAANVCRATNHSGSVNDGLFGRLLVPAPLLNALFDLVAVLHREAV